MEEAIQGMAKKQRVGGGGGWSPTVPCGPRPQPLELPSLPNRLPWGHRPLGNSHSLMKGWPVKDKWVWVGYGSVAEHLPTVSGALGSIPAQDKKSHQWEVGERRL